MDRDSRRVFLTIAGSGIALAACGKGEESGVGAVEDLMREHGVIRRILVVYRVSALHLRDKLQPVPLEALQGAAQLMQVFGEDYHEKKVEEAHLFPMLRKVGGPGAAEIDSLLAQHRRGREITQYILAACRKGGAQSNEPLAQTLEAFCLMYEEHAAREDTILFPAWKEALSAKQLAEMGELFEDIEHQTFGKDGFDDAVVKIASIEQAFGLSAATLTAPAPPAA